MGGRTGTMGRIQSARTRSQTKDRVILACHKGAAGMQLREIGVGFSFKGTCVRDTRSGIMRERSEIIRFYFFSNILNGYIVIQCSIKTPCKVISLSKQLDGIKGLSVPPAQSHSLVPVPAVQAAQQPYPPLHPHQAHELPYS